MSEWAQIVVSVGFGEPLVVGPITVNSEKHHSILSILYPWFANWLAMRTYSLQDHSQWCFSADGALRPPKISDDALFVGSRDNHLYAVDTASGNQLWQFEANHTVYSPAVTNTTVYAGCYDNSLFAIEKSSGEPRWETNVTSTVFPPVVHDNNVYAGSYNGQLYRFDAATGDIDWSFCSDGPISVKTTPVVAGNLVCAGSDDENLYLIAKSDGREKWSLGMGGPVRTIAQLHDLVYSGATNGAIQAFDTTSGVTAWIQQYEDAIRTLKPRNEQVIIGSAGDSVFAITADDGTPLWECNTEATVQSVAADDKFVYAATSDKTIAAINHQGEFSFVIDTPKPVESLRVAVDTLYVTDEGKTLHSIPLSTFDERSPQTDVTENTESFSGYSLTTDAYTPETDGFYIVLDPSADLTTYTTKLNQITTAAKHIVLIVDGNNTSISTEQLVTEAEKKINRVTVKDRRRKALETDLRHLSCKAATHSRKHIDGTKPLPDWVTRAHYFRQLTPPENHSHCPRLFVLSFQQYYGMKRSDGKGSWKLYKFAKKSDAEQGIPHSGNFIFGMTDLISRRVLRAATSYDSIIPIPGHAGGTSKPLDLTTKVIDETTPIDRRHVLARTNTVAQQKSLDDRKARYDNVKDSFEVNRDVDGDRVLVVDDICTSGASLSYAAKALFEAGATEVIGVVYGITVGHSRIREIEGPGATITDMQLVYGGGSA